MNIIEAEDTIKGLPDDYLFSEAQYPTGKLPQFLVISEIQRRQSMRDRYKAAAYKDQGTVKDQILGQSQQTAPQAAPQAPAAMPQQGMGQGIPQTVQPSGTAYMASGGIAPGGTVYMADGGRAPERSSEWWRNHIERPKPRVAPGIYPQMWIAPSDPEELEREVQAAGGGLGDTALFRALGLANWSGTGDEFRTTIDSYKDASRRVERSDQALLNTIKAAREEDAARRAKTDRYSVNEMLSTGLEGSPTEAQRRLMYGLAPDSGDVSDGSGSASPVGGGGITSLFGSVNLDALGGASPVEKEYEALLRSQMKEGIPAPIALESYREAALKRGSDAKAEARQMALAEVLTNLGAGVMSGNPAEGLDAASKAAISTLRGGREEALKEQRYAEQINLQDANQSRQHKIDEMSFKREGLGSLAKAERDRINASLDAALKQEYYNIARAQAAASSSSDPLTAYRKAIQDLPMKAEEALAKAMAADLGTNWTDEVKKLWKQKFQKDQMTFINSLYGIDERHYDEMPE